MQLLHLKCEYCRPASRQTPKRSNGLSPRGMKCAARSIWPGSCRRQVDGHWRSSTEKRLWNGIKSKASGESSQVLHGRIQKRYGIAREEAERQVDEWSNALLDIVEAAETR